MESIELARVNRFVLGKQHLTQASRSDDIVQIAGDIMGLHATGIKEPSLILFSRMHKFTPGQLDTELYHKKTLGKICCMRGTLFILPRELIPVAHAATRKMVENLSVRFFEFRGISQSQYTAVSQKILDILKGTELSAAGIKRELDNNLNLSSVLNLMCDQGLLVRIQHGNNWTSRNYRYALFSEFFPDIALDLSETEATTLLVRHYLHSFGPATEADIIWWTGLGHARIHDALKSLSNEITRITIPDLVGDYIMLNNETDELCGINLKSIPGVNLLPLLDPYVMGYKLRDRYVRQEYYNLVLDSSGNATSTVMVDGRITGIWDFSAKPESRVKLFRFEPISQKLWQTIEKKARSMAEFMAGDKCAIEKVATMIPLTQRNAGGFMSPLRDSHE